VDPGLGAQRAALDQPNFAVGKRMFVKRRLDEIPVHCGKIRKPELLDATRTVT
jgi:hypothetical protein